MKVIFNWEIMLSVGLMVFVSEGIKLVLDLGFEHLSFVPLSQVS
jgi:hypothetical protein